MSRKVILYISMSLDGYLSKENDDLSWLSTVEKPGEDYGYAQFNKEIDTYIVGKKTYDVILSLTGGTFPQAAVHDCYVITRQKLNSENGVTFFNGSVNDLIQDLKSKPGKNIYCDGGATLVRMLLEDRLIDEFRISIIPILLGNGKRLFQPGFPEENLELISSKSYDTGLITLTYKPK
ncbi:MAG: dihydrofolate reductase family protein [Flavobacteriaceae bacterium]